jgi:uncharacterized repeat protein (TIGR03803 family)
MSIRKLLVGAAVLAGSASSTFADEQVIYSFSAPSYYRSGVVLDRGGNLYGTDYAFGGQGAIYRLHQKGARRWRFDIVHQFATNDGASPSAALIEDQFDKRLFYGVTGYGGSGNSGTVYSLAHTGGSWTETVLHNFQFGPDGAVPAAPLWQDKTTGALFGTVGSSGSGNCGAAFELSPSGETWQFSTLYRFQGGSDGCIPETQLQAGPAPGTLVGSTYEGGINNRGAIFELTSSGGSWTESVVHSFDGADGNIPSDLAGTNRGIIYGVANTGGENGVGVMFELRPQAGGGWRYKIVHSFTLSEPYNPVGLLLDRQTGTLYGTAQNGGSAGFGAVFKFVPNGKEWTLVTLHDFYGGGDGANPAVRPTLDAKSGVLYGLTAYGGVNNAGAAYTITP